MTYEGVDQARARGSPGLGLALLVLFALPMITVSCMGEDVARASGYALALGGEARAVDMPEMGVDAGATEDIDVEPLATVALLLAVGAAGLGVVPTDPTHRRWPAVALLGVGAAGAVALITLVTSLSGQAREEGMGLAISPASGWWLTLAAFLGVAGLNGVCSLPPARGRDTRRLRQARMRDRRSRQSPQRPPRTHLLTEAA